MSFRARLTVLTTLAVAIAIAGTSFVVYYTDRHELIGQVDSDLSESLTLPRVVAVAGVACGVEAARRRESRAQHHRRRRAHQSEAEDHGTLQRRLAPFVHGRPGAGCSTPGGRGSREEDEPRFGTVTIKGVRTRVLTFVTADETVRVSRSLVEVDRNLAHLRWLLVFICLGGIGAATILGSLVSGRAMAPLRRLTETTERIIDTGDLSERTGQRGRDEISRLSARLDELLATLEQSLRAQRQLVADASHELRTPITTLRANIGLLAEPGTLDHDERAGLMTDVQDEARVDDDAWSVSSSSSPEAKSQTSCHASSGSDELDHGTAVDRTARRAPGLRFRTQLEPSVVTGVPERVERAVSNLLDNARKWSPASARGKPSTSPSTTAWWKSTRPRPWDHR